MPNYEYKVVSNIYEINNLGSKGWRIVPGVGERDKVMMERPLPEPELDTPEPVQREHRACGAVRSGGWGSSPSTCTFKDGHLSAGIPHSWVTT